MRSKRNAPLDMLRWGMILAHLGALLGLLVLASPRAIPKPIRIAGLVIVFLLCMTSVGLICLSWKANREWRDQMFFGLGIDLGFIGMALLFLVTEIGQIIPEAILVAAAIVSLPTMVTGLVFFVVWIFTTPDLASDAKSKR